MDVVVFCVIVLLLAAFVATPLYRAAEPPAPSDPAPPEAAGRVESDLEVDLASGLITPDEYTFEQRQLGAPGRPTD